MEKTNSKEKRITILVEGTQEKIGIDEIFQK